MIRKHFKKIVILSLFFLLVSGFGIKSAVGKRKGVPAWICMTVTGDITGGPACRGNRIMDNTTQLVVHDMNYNLSYFQTVVFKEAGDGAACFSEGTYYDRTLAVVKEPDGTAWARFYFNAFVNDGATELLYGLHMYGTFDSDPKFGKWPPDPNGTTLIHLDSWEIFSEGRGKLKKISCTGSGEFTPEFTTITVTRNDL